MIFRTLRGTCALLATVCLLVLATDRSAAAQTTMMLEWDPSSGEVGYRVHVGEQSGSYTQHFDVGSATLFTFQTATPGQRYCFAVSAYLLASQVEGANSSEICGYSNEPPTLVNPGNRTSTVGQNVTLQLVGSDPASQPLTYSATGLPPGLSVMASTGFISGAGTTAGTYNVTVRAFDGVLTASQPFTWVMSAAAGDTTRPTLTISTPTTGTTYSATSSTMSLGGTAADNVAVSQVRWASDRGGSGVASGTTNWSVTGIPLLTGTNIISATALDAAGNQRTVSLTVTYTATTPDGTRPTVAISTPTSGTTYSTTSSTMSVGGTAADNVAVSQVRWANDRGGSGVASGTTNWSVSGIPLVRGTNIISVSALDAAGNQRTASLTVTRTRSTLDSTRPTISIATPTSGTTYSTTSRTINLTGAAADNVGVTQATWTNDRGGSGVANGTTSWAIASIPLVNGTNIITVMALDAAGNTGVDTLTVMYSGTSTPSQPAATLYVGEGARYRTARLSWTGASWPSVDVYRDGVRVMNTDNDGTTGDPVPRAGTFIYRICAPGSTAVCSNSVSVSIR